MSHTPVCWCGNTSLVAFNDDYLRCAQCETLVTRGEIRIDAAIKDDGADFYGRDYWFKHQERDLGLANIETRSRTDLPERCQHWLKTILRYKLPPGRTLEIGCAHGGFVAMLREAGFDSTGLELSPAIVDFARKTFDVPMLLGPIEHQNIAPGTIDLLVMMDVMEHLPDPMGTLACCAKLLSPGGILTVQTPRYPEGKSYQEMLATNDPFIQMLRADEHLYLFSERSAREIFSRVGLGYVIAEPAMFSGYDMFLFASAEPAGVRAEAEVNDALLGSPRGRITLCWLDMHREREALRETVAEIEGDRAMRLENIQSLTREAGGSRQRIAEIEADREIRLAMIETLTKKIRDLEKTFAEVEADRGERLKQIETLTARITEIENDRQSRLEQIETLTSHAGGQQALIAEIQVDRQKRLEQIETLTAEVLRLRDFIAEIETDRANRLDVIHKLDARVRELQTPRR